MGPVRAGDHIAVMLPNCPEPVPLVFACARFGAVLVPVNTACRGPLLHHVLATCDASTLVVDEMLFNRVVGQRSDLPSLKRLIVRRATRSLARVPRLTGRRSALPGCCTYVRPTPTETWLRAPRESGDHVSVAKAWVGSAYRRVCASAHQVYGAIGFAREHDLARFTRHAITADLAYGEGDFHRERIASDLDL